VRQAQAIGNLGKSADRTFREIVPLRDIRASHSTDRITLAIRWFENVTKSPPYCHSYTATENDASAARPPARQTLTGPRRARLRCGRGRLAVREPALDEQLG